MDGTGVPMVSKELEGRKGKGSNGRAHTREVKLGCVFTQTTVDAEGWPVRDEDSTTYTGAIETAEEFSRRLYTEAQQRGWDRAQQKVVMGDGAEWIWNRTQEIFPGATEIVASYFERNAARMRYPKFRKQGLFVGSGVIEAGCKTLIATRLKRSGMFWTVRGANAVIAVRCCRHSREFDDYWESRRP